MFIDSDTTLENSTKEDNSLTHFSSFAISAKDGSTRWHHLPGDFGEVDTSVKVTFIFKMFKRRKLNWFNIFTLHESTALFYCCSSLEDDIRIVCLFS